MEMRNQPLGRRQDHLLRPRQRPLWRQLWRQIWRTYLPFLLLFAFAFLMLVPMLWVLSGSLQTQGMLYKNPFNWIPTTWHWSNYMIAWNGWQGLNYITGIVQFIPGIGSAFIASIMLIVMCLPFGLCTAVYIAWVLAKYRFPGRNLLMGLILGTLFMPPVTGLFVNYFTIKNLGLIDNWWGVATPGLVGSAFGIFLIMQFARAISDDYLDAARIDGANDLWIFLRIGVPLLRAPIATLAILWFNAGWGEYTWTHLIINTPAKQTLPMALLFLAQAPDSGSAQTVDQAVLLAGSVISFAPVLLLFLIFQKQFIAAVGMQAGLKG